MKSFREIIQQTKKQPLQKIAVAVAQDVQVLEAVMDAKAQGIADAILVGDFEQIQPLAMQIGLDIGQFEVFHEPDKQKAALKAVELVSTRKADMVMKGLVETATFLKAVLDKEIGLRTGKRMSHVAVFEIPTFNKLLFITDAAFNMYPDLNAKIDILRNAVRVAHAVGLDTPRVALVCAVEVVNLDSPATMDAAILSKMNERGQITGCIVDGPLGLDIAISEEAATHKNVGGPVAGKADIVVLPNFEAGNVMYKTLTYTTVSQNGGILVGTSAPVILTSRADSHEAKMNSIALACLVAHNKNYEIPMEMVAK
ncbi:MAG: phosphate butyryltransferase [Desulfitobacteriaceae bacterium]|nr:phosphate butyryltransferase [Desulfitobacteriaceae bacterium]